jgi:FKBP-type peptidyl-prolyl cis-trans isomerase
MKVLHICSLLALAACASAEHDGFTEVEDGVHLRLHALGEGTRVATDEDSVRMRIRIAMPDSPAGSFFSTEQHYAVRDLRTDVMRVALERLHEGDSMSLIAPGDAFPWEQLTRTAAPSSVGAGPLRAELLMVDLITPTEIAARREAARMGDPEGYELRLITAWLAQQDTAAFVRWGTSLVFYRVEGLPIDTLPVRKGDLVSIRCEGRRLEDGVVVDDSDRHGGTYDWRYGDTEQVINGLEIAANLFGNGGSGTIILPAAYAFGADGVEGLVPPYCPMRYHIRSVSISRPQASVKGAR